MTNQTTASTRSTDGELDVAVVLGAAVWEGGKPSPSLLRRTVHGARLVLGGKAKVLIVSGGVGRFPPSEAAVMQRIALEQGISEQSILMDERSANTLESAIRCSEIIKNQGWQSAWIVSDRYHLIRSVVLFRKMGILAKGSAPDRHGTGTSRAHWYYLHARELLALPWSLLKVTLIKPAKRGTLGEQRNGAAPDGKGRR